MVTLIEIYNNRFLQGDFEQLISLIDGYNKQQSNRIDDKEAFVNSLMVLKGQTLGDTSDEKAETVRSIKENGVVELTPDGELSFLTRQSDQQGDQLLSESIAKDIHKFSYIPDLTDEHFASNVSGVAMQFKLWGLLQLMKKKERYIKEGLRYRIKLFSAILAIKGKTPVDVSKVTITITRNLPKNLVELAQVIGNLSGICSNETLVAQLPFVEDPEKEVQKATEEKQAAMDAEFVMASKSVNDNDTE
jgi:SPP1 family phage portal protein